MGDNNRASNNSSMTGPGGPSQTQKIGKYTKNRQKFVTTSFNGFMLLLFIFFRVTKIHA
jgi:hypothetical protein